MTTVSVQLSPTGIPFSVPNRVTAISPDFYVSLNTYDSSVYGCDTTAVVVGNMERFYVLCGNHEAALAGKSFVECLSYLHAHASELHRHSDALPPVAPAVTR